MKVDPVRAKKSRIPGKAQHRCAALLTLARVGFVVMAAAALPAQDFQQRGFLETRLTMYPQTAPNDRGRVVAESLLRYEASRRVWPWLRLHIGGDARVDSHRQVDRAAHLSWDDRTLARPALLLRRVSAVLTYGPLTFEAGRQFIRWGKTDILNPTDRFAPRDYLAVVDNDFLSIWAARATLDRGPHNLDVVVAPHFTPSRTPLLNQRWTVTPAALNGIALQDEGARYPGGTQWGVRYHHTASRYEAAVCLYEGFNHLPQLEGRLVNTVPPVAGIQRFYPALRLYGGDFAMPTRWATLKAEAAWFTSRDARVDEYVLYVVQLERQIGEWSLVGGYAGEAVTMARNPFFFSPDRGFAKAFVGRAAVTLDAQRSLAFESAIRQNGHGVYVRGEYSQLIGAHWRATAGVSVIRGQPDDFLGQYRRNSFVNLSLRYSF